MKVPAFCKFVKIVVFVPQSHAEKLRKVMAKAGAGKLGNYDSCSFSVKGVGRFRGLFGANPFIGKTGRVESVQEERVEVLCAKTVMKKVLKAIYDHHPYDMPAVEVYPLLFP